MNENLQALPLAAIGAVEGVYTYLVKPALVDLGRFVIHLWEDPQTQRTVDQEISISH